MTHARKRRRLPAARRLSHRLTGLTAAEAEALFLSGLPGPAAELGLGSVLAAATLKLQAALPAPLRGNADRLAERFYLDAPGWYRRPEDVPTCRPWRAQSGSARSSRSPISDGRSQPR
ncbi:MAG TPA: hypothetical protein VFE59_37010 [Trebonia sp.]|nr:hypothetical protein [Trebonia sp.]